MKFELDQELKEKVLRFMIEELPIKYVNSVLPLIQELQKLEQVKEESKESK